MDVDARRRVGGRLAKCAGGGGGGARDFPGVARPANAAHAAGVVGAFASSPRAMMARIVARVAVNSSETTDGVVTETANLAGESYCDDTIARSVASGAR